MSELRVIVSGGGTGGHIFPAIAIADAIISADPTAKILFVGANGKMEMEKVPAAGYEIKGLNIVGLQRRITLKNLAFPFKLMASMKAAKKIVREFKPDVAVGVGGYASGPLLKVAGRQGVATVLQEQNSYPGLTNRLLAKKAKRICVAYDNMDRFFDPAKIVLTGNPVRESVVEIDGKREEAIKNFGLDPSKKTLLVIGGSLGARTVNDAIKAAMPLFKENDLQVIWQTGKYYSEEMILAASEFGYDGIHPSAFITTMDLAYSAADCVVSRAGAISISELCLVKKPVILVPSPNVSEDHQTKNAMALVEKSAAILMKDVEAVESLGKIVVELFGNSVKQKELSENIAKLGKRNAANAIREEIIKLSKEK
ncbi:MAG: UDP-N-acetylglucosamine--N-acetylmuramyl-(pentapeptide) pyrophosphoryl-undecaprenol N-acetylglucosamine transferase [Parvicellaceae bacterium]|jgi:UDP-N-acetylglucosamine--N-acetylmuramyl-(pentapeptide) pyrophosphoryl-undecaprenol N-acetylglucosamine transferase